MAVTLRVGQGAGGNTARADEALLTRLPTGKILHHRLNHYPQQHYFLYIPRRGGAQAPIMVTIHGISRNVTEHMRLFMPYAERNGVVLVAPYFPQARYPDYQRLGRVGRGQRADVMLAAIIQEVGRLTRAHTDKVYLFGYSGGAQFVHHYTLAYPERVAKVVVGAAGRYSFPDTTIRFPLGIKKSTTLPDVRFEPPRFLRVPMAVVVGERDVKRDLELYRSPKVDRQQGRTRLERGKRWIDAMQAAARAQGLSTAYEFHVLPRSRHSFSQCMVRGKMGEVVFKFLFGDTPHSSL